MVIPQLIHRGAPQSAQYLIASASPPYIQVSYFHTVGIDITSVLIELVIISELLIGGVVGNTDRALWEARMRLYWSAAH